MRLPTIQSRTLPSSQSVSPTISAARAVLRLDPDAGLPPTLERVITQHDMTPDQVKQALKPLVALYRGHVPGLHAATAAARHVASNPRPEITDQPSVTDILLTAAQSHALPTAFVADSTLIKGGHELVTVTFATRDLNKHWRGSGFDCLYSYSDLAQALIDRATQYSGLEGDITFTYDGTIDDTVLSTILKGLDRAAKQILQSGQTDVRLTFELPTGKGYTFTSQPENTSQPDPSYAAAENRYAQYSTKITSEQVIAALVDNNEVGQVPTENLTQRFNWLINAFNVMQPNSDFLTNTFRQTNDAHLSNILVQDAITRFLYEIFIPGIVNIAQQLNMGTFYLFNLLGPNKVKLTEQGPVVINLCSDQEIMALTQAVMKKLEETGT